MAKLCQSVHRGGVAVAIFSPKIYLSKLEDLDPIFIKDKGLEGIIIDLDNTLVKRGTTFIPEGIKKWILLAKEKNLTLIIISNSGKPRTAKIAHELDLPYLFNALKPLPFAYYQASRRINIPLKKLALVGDQIFTDILGGNIVGTFTVLVEPIAKETDFFTTKILRLLEGIVLLFQKRGKK